MSHAGLGSEHPLNDKLQPVFILLFFTSLIVDSFQLLPLGFSTVLYSASTYPLLLLPAAALMILGVFLMRESHKKVLFSSNEEAERLARFVDAGVYSWVRHPMYLGELLFLLGFLSVSVSMIAFLVWISFFIFMDRMAAYEEGDLVNVLGERYLNYMHRVPRWLPKLRV